MAKKRIYYDTQQRVYWLLTRHPSMSYLLDDFDIDKDRVQNVSKYLLENHEEIYNFPLNAFYSDSDIIDDIADIYGFSDPPWNQYYSPNNTPLLELLNMTLFIYKFGVTDNFYEQNILYFIPEYDKEEMEKKPKIKLTMQAIGAKLDELEDKISRMTDLYNIDEAPEHVLDYLGQNLGYEREDFTLSNISFRELLNNIIEIYKVKGTNYSFSFFFKFLGFDVELKEFYFNRDVQNPENFPGMDPTKVEYYLTTKNPKFDYGDSSLGIHLKPAKHLNETRSLDDWQIEYDSLISKGCINPIEFMTGRETFNNEDVRWHKKPWTYFKTNLIEYELNPFFDKLNLSASDNTTIRKYIRFLSPTYLFTWINVNLRPWIENISLIKDYSDDEEDFSNWQISINKVLGDPRPTPEPWPFTRRTNQDLGFNGYYNDGIYLDYDDVYDQLNYRYSHGYWDKVEINDLIEVLDTFSNVSDLPQQVQHGDTYFVLAEALYYRWDDELERFIQKFELDEEEDNFLGNIQTRMFLPRKIRDGSLYYVSGSNEYYRWQNDDYVLIDPMTLVVITGAKDKISDLPLDAKRDLIYEVLEDEVVKRFEPEIDPITGEKNTNYWIEKNVLFPAGFYKRIGREVTIEVTNNMDLGGFDTMGTVLRRNGVHIRQQGHPRHITDARHRGDKKLSFDLLDSNIKFTNEDEEEYREYSYRAWPSAPLNPSPFYQETVSSSNMVNFSWDEVEGYQYYWVQLSRDRNFNMYCFDERHVPTNSFSCPNILHNDLYYWRVRSRNELNITTLSIDEMNSIVSRIEEYVNLSPSDPGYKSQYSFLEPDDIDFPNTYYTFDGTNFYMKNDLESFDRIRMNSILSVVGKPFEWSPWSNVWNFTLRTIPFPYDNEVIEEESYFVSTNYNRLNENELIFTTASFNLLWPRVIATFEYDVEIYVEGELIPPVRTSPSNSLNINLGNNTYDWRYRSKDINRNPREWSDFKRFTINFPQIITG